MIRRPPRSTRTDTLCPDTTLFRSEIRPVAVAFHHVEMDEAPVPRAVRARDRVPGRLAVIDPRRLPGGEGGMGDFRLELPPRSETRRVGKECVSPFRSR